MTVRLVVATGLALLVGAVALTLSHEAPRHAGLNAVQPSHVLAQTSRGGVVCQGGEVLPADTAAIRLSLVSDYGPPLGVTVTHAGRLLTRGALPAGWGGAQATVRVRRTSHDVLDTTVCAHVGAGTAVGVLGGTTPPGTGTATGAGRPLGGSMRIEYFRPGRESWWSYATTVASRIGVARERWGGSWMAVAIGLLVLASAAIAIAGVTRARSTTVAALSCAAVGVLNATAWGLITPPLQGVDEFFHVAYIQQLVEGRSLPEPRSTFVLPHELAVAIRDLHVLSIAGIPQNRPLWSAASARAVQRELSQPLRRRGNGDAGAATNEPPLYYSLEAAPYALASNGTLLDRIAVMRLLSALFAGATALFTFLFIREALPGTPWAWTVGAVGVALVPMLGSVSGVLNPDALLFAVSAALFFCIARCFRRGVTTRMAVATGLTIAIGLLTKVNFIGLAPGAIVALVLAARRQQGRWVPGPLRLAGIASAAGLTPLAGLLLRSLSSSARPSLGTITQELHATSTLHGTFGGELSYLWQLYLPRLPGLHDYFPRSFPLYDNWFITFVGAFGSLDSTFPRIAYSGALVVAIILITLLVRTLVLRRSALRQRLPELAAYLLMMAGLLVIIAAASYLLGLVDGGSFGTSRYLLPLLAPFGLLLALAARAGGRRWGPALGAAIVVLGIGWSLFGQLITIARYYG
jgi:Predicted membrane protein (DUF2142)